MTTPTDPNEAAVEKPRTVRVPIRRGDSIFSADEHAEVDVEAAGQWDVTQWHDRPPL
jgi:hypothetical protein